MPRPKPDKIVRHQIVFGEADRKILEGYKDAYLLSNMSSNFVKLINDVTGTATFLALVAASGALGVTFVFTASSIALAAGGSSVFDEFFTQWKGERDKAGADKVRKQAEYAAKGVGGVIDPIPGDPVAKLVDFLIPDKGLWGK
tara:strand:+ start:348 stop:776 length:429 start_codon:yes stop_codon:yes gene_type:complete